MQNDVAMKSLTLYDLLNIKNGKKNMVQNL